MSETAPAGQAPALVLNKAAALKYLAERIAWIKERLDAPAVVAAGAHRARLAHEAVTLEILARYVDEVCDDGE